MGKFFEFFEVRFEVREEYPWAKDSNRGEPIFENIGLILIITSSLNCKKTYVVPLIGRAWTAARLGFRSGFSWENRILSTICATK
ncbi:MAG: hypothetical protein ABFD62_19000 [Syntrophaceae bacterium]